MHKNHQEKELEEIFNKNTFFEKCLWKNMVEKLIIEMREKCISQKKEFHSLENENLKLATLLEIQEQENLKLKNIFVAQEKSRADIINEELMKYKEKVVLSLIKNEIFLIDSVFGNLE